MCLHLLLQGYLERRRSLVLDNVLGRGRDLDVVSDCLLTHLRARTLFGSFSPVPDPQLLKLRSACISCRRAIQIAADRWVSTSL